MIKAILFDFDETLVSSRQANYQAYQEVIRTFKIDIQDSEELFQAIWYRTISSSEALNKLTTDHVLIKKIQQTLHYFYQKNHLEYIKVYPNILATLEKLRSQNFYLGIVSLKIRSSGEKELDACGLRQFFDIIVWGNDVSKPKPDTEACQYVLEKLSLTNKQVLICGDGPDDVKMGKTAQITTVGALWGDTNQESLLEAKPDYLCYNPEDILSIINNNFN